MTEPQAGSTRGVRRPRGWLDASRTSLVALAIAGGALQLVLTGSPFWFVYDVVAGLPPKDELARISDMAEATVIYDRADRAAFSVFQEQRREVPLAAMSPLLVKAIIAIEDQRFYDHSGIDLVRIVGAGLANLREGRRAQGGSTLTQQLARQSFLKTDKTYTRKLREALLATRIEREFTKDQILELYLNKMYFGAGLYGAEAAALGYFGKPSKDLTLDQAALLAGLMKSPSTLAPTVSVERAVARRNLVLGVMHDSGLVGDEEWTRAKSAPVALDDALRREEPFGQYYKEAVRLELVERFGFERVYQGGLKAYTTIDLGMQKAAEAAVAASLRDLDARRVATLKARRRAATEPAQPLQAALVAIDPTTGDVRAMVGGRSFDESHFNRAVQARRQPGSAFKPFVYAAALEAGYTPASLIEHLDEPLDLPEGAWTPEDAHASAPQLTMRTALRTSSNRAAVRMLEEIGIDTAVAYAKKLGVGSMPSVPSLALGSGEVTLLDMTSAYGAFAAGGVLHHPRLVRRVEDSDGTVLFSAEDASEQAVTPQTAFLMSTMLADVVNAGTAWKARQLGFTLPAGGKTGTTNDYHDAWFVGFTPSLTGGVWVGYDTPQPILPGSAYAGDVAVPLWAEFMKRATAGQKPEWIPVPKNIVAVEVCRLSGKRPAGGCNTVEVALESGGTDTRSMVFTEYFVKGTEPSDTCPLHVGRSLFARLTDWMHAPAAATSVKSSASAPVRETAAVVPPEPVQAPAVEKDDQPRKRGFWSRLFGRKKDADEKPKKK